MYTELEHVLKFLFLIFILPSEAFDKNRKSVGIKTKYEPGDCNQEVVEGDTIYIHYTGSLESGEIFDSSRGKSPLSLVVGGGKVIEGLSIGVTGMCIGEKRQITIPPERAYGKSGYPPYIPADATLTFDVELLSIKSTSAEEVVFRLLRFLVAPVAAMCIVMYLYKKYQKFPTKKELKGMKKGRKKT